MKRAFIAMGFILLLALAFIVGSTLCAPGIVNAGERDYAAIVGSYGTGGDVVGGGLRIGRVNGDLRGELGIGLNGDRVGSLSIGGGYRVMTLAEKVSLWATAATGWKEPDVGSGAPFAAAGLSLGVPLGERYAVSLGYTYSRNWVKGTGGGTVGLRFTMFLNGP